MYKGLKSELEDIVNKLKEGDGVVIELDPNLHFERMIGYVYSKNKNRLRLTEVWDTKTTSWFHSWSVSYGPIQNITIVTRIDKD